MGVYPVLLRATIATFVAAVGGGIGVALGGVAPRRLAVLIYAATGALLAVACCDVLPEAKEALSWPAFGLAATSGYVLFLLIGRFISPVCPSCARVAFDEETRLHLGRTAGLLMAALSLHSLMDGLAVVVSDTLTGRADLALLLALSLHKLPEGLALATLLIGAGFSRRAALVWTLGIEACTEVGALLGVFALHSVRAGILALLFAHIGGGFLYLVASSWGAFSPHGMRAAGEPPPAPPHRVGVTVAAFVVVAVILLTAERYER